MPGPTSSQQDRGALLAGNPEAACTAFEEHLQLNPADAECWFLLGTARHRLLRLDAARDAFFRAAALEPRAIQPRFALAAVCLALGDAKTATTACVEATDLAPDDPDAWFSLAVAHEASGCKDVALDAYDRALRLAPEHAGALKNRRVLLMATGRFAEAVVQSRTVAAKQPFSVEAQFNLGESLTAAHCFVEAVRVFGRAAALSPGNARVALHYGFALAQLERFAEAQQMLDRAAELDQTQLKLYRQAIFGEEKGDAQLGKARLDARALFLLRHYDQIERCNWSEREYFISRFSDLIGESRTSPMTERALGFRAMAMGLDGRLQLELAQQIAAGVGEKSVACTHVQPSRLRQGRIKVGYLSPSFRNDPVGLLAQKLFSWHDRERFEIVAYALGGADGSEVRQQIVNGCDDFVDLDLLDDAAAARKITDDSVDILVDLMGYADKSRPGILARRPAPLQISWLAYVATTGAPWIDYLVADAVSLPTENARYFSEAVIHVPPALYLCSYANNILAAAPDRDQLGLPASGLVLGAMHNSYKIDPGIFSVWMRFLKLRPDAVLYLLDTLAEAKTNLMAEASARGIAPGRLVFAPRVSHDEHLVRLQRVDLMLDTPQCNGGTSTADALVAGVPVLTCLGKTIAQRMAASMLSSVGLDHLITESLEAYESLGAALLTDTGHLHQVRQQLQTARSTAPFFSPRQWVLPYEKALCLAWQKYCQGEPPTSFELGV